MISSSHKWDLDAFVSDVDALIYGLGYESRCLEVARRTEARLHYAIKMPSLDLHSYGENLKEADIRAHSIVDDFDAFLRRVLPDFFQTQGQKNVRIGVDISSINRAMLFRLMSVLAMHCRQEDVVQIFYTPAAFDEPDWRFPQIESLGPISPEFSGFSADPEKPLCLILGLGFEPGVSMGIISQLEPSASFCFWGNGSDERFEDAVKKANFDFSFTGFNTLTRPYDLFDPIGTYTSLESLSYGLIRDFNVILVPMGPKIFAFLSFLVGMAHPGSLAIWRAAQLRAQPFDARAGESVIQVTLDARTLSLAARQRHSLLAG